MPAAPAAPALPLEHVAVGAPITRLGVSLFPLYLHQAAPDIASGEEDLVIEELPSAEVPTLRFTNGAGRPVLVPAGSLVSGGLQNRMVNVSVLLPAATALDVPVSCVQAGRWSGQGAFTRGRSFAPRRVRRTNELTVDLNLRSGRGARADQRHVWATVDHELHREGLASATRDLEELDRRVESDERRRRTVTELVARGPLPGQRGLAVAHGARVVAADVFATHELLAANWEALIRSHLAELPDRPAGHPSSGRVLRFLRRFAHAEATVTRGAGLGRERHVATDRVAGQMLELDDVLVHASAFALAA
ncbi:MAG: hypothetical protein RLZZ353_955 [Actinomycetota bacterium]|jgi:hypothetical protein